MDTWVAQPVKRQTSAQVIILWFVSLSLASCYVLTAQSLEPALFVFCVSLSLCPTPAYVLSLSKINTFFLKNKVRGMMLLHMKNYNTTTVMKLMK